MRAAARVQIRQGCNGFACFAHLVREDVWDFKPAYRPREENRPSHHRCAVLFRDVVPALRLMMEVREAEALNACSEPFEVKRLATGSVDHDAAGCGIVDEHGRDESVKLC